MIIRMSKDRVEIKLPTLSNVIAKRLVSNIDQIFMLYLDTIMMKELDRKYFKIVWRKFPPIISVSRQIHSFTDEQIKYIQIKTGNWYHDWMSIAGLQ